jgi:hypothetical protein
MITTPLPVLWKLVHHLVSLHHNSRFGWVSIYSGMQDVGEHLYLLQLLGSTQLHRYFAPFVMMGFNLMLSPCFVGNA